MPKAALKEDAQPISNSRIKEYTKRWLTVNEEIRSATDSRKDLKKEIKASGISIKELAIAVRVLENPIPDISKDIINLYCEINGQRRLFA